MAWLRAARGRLELADFASWQWGWACDGAACAVDEAVCAALAAFATRACGAPLDAAPTDGKSTADRSNEPPT
jgi:hypothetical protein